MEDWKVRLVEEYKQLAERHSKLAKALNDPNIIKKVGSDQHFYMIAQYTGMRIYREALRDRLEDLEIEVE